jgi:hypothetical protein
MKHGWDTSYKWAFYPINGQILEIYLQMGIYTDILTMGFLKSMAFNVQSGNGRFLGYHYFRNPPQMAMFMGKATINPKKKAANTIIGSRFLRQPDNPQNF